MKEFFDSVSFDVLDLKSKFELSLQGSTLKGISQKKNKKTYEMFVQ